jgi:hypothetical protein
VASPLRVVAFSLVIMLALGITLVAWFFVALTESNLDAYIGPLPLGKYLDEPGLKTAEDGIATFEGDAKVAYPKDPDGHTLSIPQPPRS